MSCLNVYLSTFLVVVLISCGDPQPVSTGTKAPGLKPVVAAPATSTTGGDASKGQTALANCTGCHNAKTAHTLVKADAGSIDAAGPKSYHSSVTNVFSASAADIKAYLATQ